MSKVLKVAALELKYPAEKGIPIKHVELIRCKVGLQMHYR
jgi:hypothetical protein